MIGLAIGSLIGGAARSAIRVRRTPYDAALRGRGTRPPAMHGPGRPWVVVVCLAACLAACATSTGSVAVTSSPSASSPAGAASVRVLQLNLCNSGIARAASPAGQRPWPPRRSAPRETRPGHPERGLPGRRGDPGAGARGGRPRGRGLVRRSSPRATGGTGSRTAAATATSTASASCRGGHRCPDPPPGAGSTRPRTGRPGATRVALPGRRGHSGGGGLHHAPGGRARGRSQVHSAGTCSARSSPG